MQINPERWNLAQWKTQKQRETSQIRLSPWTIILKISIHILAMTCSVVFLYPLDHQNCNDWTRLSCYNHTDKYCFWRMPSALPSPVSCVSVSWLLNLCWASLPSFPPGTSKAPGLCVGPRPTWIFGYLTAYLSRGLSHVEQKTFTEALPGGERSGI